MAGEQNSNFNPANGPDQHWHLVAEGGWLVGQRFQINGHALLGRDSSCDITIPGTHLSRRHAELAVNEQSLLIRDLNSANGTYVNNRRITETELKPGDTIQFDVLLFRVQGPSAATPVKNNVSPIRQPEVVSKPSETPISVPTVAAKQWKTEAVATPDRQQTVKITTTEKAVSSLGVVMTALLALATVAAVGYLITQL